VVVNRKEEDDMNDLQDWSRRAANCIVEATEVRANVADGLGAEIDGANEVKRHALLSLRVEVEAAASELSVAGQRMAAIA